MLIDKDWLETYKSKLDYYNKTRECIDNEGYFRTMKSVLKHISIRQVLAL